MFGQPVPACKPIGCHPQLQSFVWILHMPREKFWLAAAHSVRFRNWREIYSRDISIVQVAMAAVHEDEITHQAYAVRAGNLRLNESGVLTAPQDLCADLYFARQRPNKRDLGGLQRGKVISCELSCLIGQHGTQAAIGRAPLMPCRRNRDFVSCGPGGKLGEKRCEVHNVSLAKHIQCRNPEYKNVKEIIPVALKILLYIKYFELKFFVYKFIY